MVIGNSIATDAVVVDAVEKLGDDSGCSRVVDDDDDASSPSVSDSSSSVISFRGNDESRSTTSISSLLPPPRTCKRFDMGLVVVGVLMDRTLENHNVDNEEEEEACRRRRCCIMNGEDGVVGWRKASEGRIAMEDRLHTTMNIPTQ